jgi:hypothetical protein
MSTNWVGRGTTNTQAGSQQVVTADIVRYVNKVPDDSGGWLKIRKEPYTEGSKAEFEFLYKYTKLMLLYQKGGRTYFKVVDSHRKGLTASLADENATSYLGKTAPKQTGVELVVTYGQYDRNWKSVPRQQTLKQQLATVTINGVTAQAAMNSVWKEDGPVWKNYYPIEPGTYKILLPDSPHKKSSTIFYQPFAKKLINHQVWLPIEFGDNSRFVHVGHLSDGCTTIVDLDSWDAVYEQLISHRASDGISVGTMVVKGKRERVLEEPPR